MKKFATSIAFVFGLLMAMVIVLPGAHMLGHDIVVNKMGDNHGDVHLTKSSVDCSICDFQLAPAQDFVAFHYDLYIPQKESLYSLSLKQTVHLSPNTLFSLRAPPYQVFG